MGSRVKQILRKEEEKRLERLADQYETLWVEKKKKKLSIRAQERFLSQEEKRKRRQKRRAFRLKNPEKINFYETKLWRSLRYKILRRFNFTCLACGSKPPDVVLHVDHIKPRSFFPELELDENNLQVLCEPCNIGKSNLHSDDLRPK